MAFRYALQSLLRLRRSLERQEEQRLFAFAATAARLRGALEDLQQADLSQRRAALSEMEESSSGAQLQFRVACDAASLQTIQRVKRQLVEAERLRVEQLKTYQKSRQAREILEGLRERQAELYERDQTRHRQQRADETFLADTFHKARD